ncbi:MAG: hypothetical protein HOZ81_20610 [Streptomyces sp.]|nr:hypothetical protein [Streptomyces sp.]NUS24427.1 hypothetical protein [Streptomyces sp.]
MASWVCAGCTTVYTVGAPHCPHCGSFDYYEDGTMPKIRVEGGATNAAIPVGETGPELLAPTPEEEPSPGNSSETSPEKQPSSEKPSGSKPRSRARTTENPS